MENRIKDYRIDGNSIILPRITSIEDIRLIYNETQKVLICSTAKKDNLSGIGVIVVNNFTNTTLINVPASVCVLQPTDKLTIKCDYGDDLSSVESKVEEVGNKIDNIKLPEIDTTELAKEATLNEVSNKIESIIHIDNLAADIVAGKEKLASSISYKGVYSSSADSLEDMAIKIRRIPQVSAGNSADSGTEEDSAYYDSDLQFNPYLVAKGLISNELPSYIPEYMYSYRSRYAPNSLWVGEYGFDGSIILAGADGYLTSDGHFYSFANMGDYMQITHTYPNGNEETYDASVIEHIWSGNGKANRWVAYYYFDSAYQVDTSVSKTPYSAALCGKCNIFSYSGTDVMSRIFVVGELESYTTNITNNLLDANQVIPAKYIQNYGVHYTTKVRSLCLPKLEHLSNCIVNNGGNNTSIESITLPNIKVLSVGNINFSKVQKLKHFYCGAEQVSFILNNNNQMPQYYKFIKEIHYPNLKTATGNYNSASLINASSSESNVYLDSLESINGKMQIIANDSLGSTGNVLSYVIYMPNFKRLNGNTELARRGELVNLIDLTFGELETNVGLSNWTATNVLADPDKTIQLQNNIHNHIAERVKDVSGESPLTITFSQGVRDVLLPETEALFAAKNWNIAPAKSV